MNLPKILIVDDRIENLISLEAILSGFDVTIVRAYSGMEALRETLKDDYALAILDVQMPEMDGYETLSLMRKREKTKYLPVIFVSAIHQSDLHIIKGIETGAVDFIPKPIIPEILIGKVAVFLDLYNQKNKLKELLKKQEENNRELEIQKNKAEEATRLKAMFLANMSHEIRTPLNGIIGTSRLLESSNLNEEQAELIRIITISGENLLNIINDILDFSKIEAGQIQLENIKFNLSELIHTVAKLYKFKADSKGITFNVNIDKNVPATLIGDPFRVNQVVTNLVNNALKFTEEGSVDINVEVLNQKDDKIELIFKVIDTGIGISEQGMKKLFKDFSQVDSSTTRKYGGTGLGLSICQNLVALMNGKIGVESEEGRGSEFWFKIWFEHALDEFAENSTADVEIPDNLKVLYAEDNLVNQKVTKFMLQKIKAECDIAENGMLAFEMFKQKKYDLVLMDMFMPEVNGLESAKMIREFELESKTKKPVYIVAATANAFPEDKQKCINAGMNDFISKPFNEKELIRVIKNAIKQ
ncbi:MAG: response regulator [Prolixibacteraceae bacterium]|nr:response regulator [Prolixibacteraceae bacterium]